MGSILAIPTEGSYVLEWQAVQLQGALTDHVALRRLFDNTQWNVRMGVQMDHVDFTFTLSHGSRLEQWDLSDGDWVVKSPHGRFWFMSNSEFRENFRTPQFEPTMVIIE
jgi:hypothetical protein